MQEDQEPVPGVSSRRFACDRCRCMKLRCLREGAEKETSCDRCSRADIECVTSPIFRMRNYRVGDDDSGTRLRKRQRHDDYPPQQSQPKSSAADNRLPTSALFANSIPIESFAKPDIVGSFEGGFPDLSCWNSSMKSVAPALAFSTAGPATPGSWDTENINLDHFSFDDNLDKAFASFEVAASEANLPTGTETPTSLVPPLVAQAERSSQLPSPQPTASTSHSSERCDEGVSGHFLPSDLNASDLGSQTSHVNKETHVQRLSRLNVHLLTQLSRFDKEPHKVTLSMLITPVSKSPNSVGTPVEDIVNSTHQFLDVLGLLSSSHSSRVPLSSRRLFLEPNLSKLHRNTNHYASSLLGRDGSFQSSSEGVESPTSPPELTSSEVPKHKLDSATLLLVLTCYVHILRLCVNLFAHIQEFLQEVSDSDEPCLSPIPGLDFGNLPLQSGNLQATMFVQIITNMFERMESLLGLPREFRISSRGDDRDGVLRDEDFFGIAKVVIRNEELGRSENSRGGVKSLRSCIRKVKQLLRESIAP